MQKNFSVNINNNQGGIRLSIITPVFNGIRFIESCIINVIEQNCRGLEHIIIDGGSSDGTVDVIRAYAKRYGHIKWISEKDKGQSDAMNKGIRMAQGDILGFLNVDDFYEPNVLCRIIEYFPSGGRVPEDGVRHYGVAVQVGHVAPFIGAVAEKSTVHHFRR